MRNGAITLIALLVAVITLLFYRGLFLSDHTVFSNDGTLGGLFAEQNAARFHPWGGACARAQMAFFFIAACLLAFRFTWKKAFYFAWAISSVFCMCMCIPIFIDFYYYWPFLWYGFGILQGHIIICGLIYIIFGGYHDNSGSLS